MRLSPAVDHFTHMYNPFPSSQLRVYDHDVPALFQELYVRTLAMLKVLPKQLQVRAPHTAAQVATTSD